MGWSAARLEAGMTDDAGPGLTGIHHFSATVTDVEASAAWYQRLFGMARVPVTFPHYECEDTGYAVLLLDQRSGVVIGLHANRANEREAFDECRTGLDHVSFGVADRDALVTWAARLDELGIEHPAQEPDMDQWVTELAFRLAGPAEGGSRARR
jgi:glyoxylase I family protein